MAARSASPIHYLQLNAAGQKFWLGGTTASYCPSQVKDCPAGNQTVFAPGGTSMDTEVPGGQQVYIDPNGALSFTQAHSANIPAGSSYGPFVGFMACPTEDNRWQVFGALANATVPKGDVNECLGFSAMAITYEGMFLRGSISRS
ncbi:uncharacterized protein N7446_003738 [Penicillium canescens]|uniref:uncharacterized protein n=1 Tax=Penicillium canescens TaxID=5083 RepID=UPI0026DEA27F|nr:uncharacterized protein N7446_003738 [Penicillium canescens]KAJ6066701.1 hypothetical protein N7446_003738 [Penicillium canescens]